MPNSEYLYLLLSKLCCNCDHDIYNITCRLQIKSTNLNKKGLLYRDFDSQLAANSPKKHSHIHNVVKLLHKLVFLVFVENKKIIFSYFFLTFMAN